VAGNGLLILNFFKFVINSGTLFSKKEKASSLDEKTTLSHFDSKSSFNVMIFLYVVFSSQGISLT